MQHSVDLNARRKRLRLTVRDLARLASLDRATVHRALRGGSDVLASTLSKIDAALVSEEGRVVADILDQRAAHRVASVTRAVP